MVKSNNRTIHEKIDSILKRGWSIADIARTLGTDRETISRWYNHAPGKSRERIITLALDHPVLQEDPPTNWVRNGRGKRKVAEQVE